jgi:AAHS family 4-hydroxybenzoate transporter-like MFS transporter
MTADHQVQSVRQIESPAAAKSSAWTVTVCFLVVLLDGLDTTSIAFVAPALTREWGISPAAFTPAFVATSIGAVVGYMACGPLAQRFGQRTVATASVLLFGIGTLLTVFADNITTLSILRFLTAIGLGGALPVAVATAADVMPAKYREMAAMIVATGLSAGSVVGGVAGIPLMQNFGWKSVFILGGLLPLVLLPAFLSVPPRATAPTGIVSAPPGNPIAALFAEGLALRTCLLWLFAFLIFLDAYALIFWVPTLLSSFGFAPSQAPIGTAAFGMGGLVGNVVMMAIVAKIGVKRMLMLTTLIAIAGIVLISRGAIPQGLVLPHHRLCRPGRPGRVLLSAGDPYHRRRLVVGPGADRLNRRPRRRRADAVARLGAARHRADGGVTGDCRRRDLAGSRLDRPGTGITSATRRSLCHSRRAKRERETRRLQQRRCRALVFDRLRAESSGLDPRSRFARRG